MSNNSFKTSDIPIEIWITAGLVFLAYFAGLFVDLLVVDAAIYAHIAMEMVLTNDYLNIRVLGVDWLDKPHLQFWMIAIAYKLFGISTVVYKLPAFLCIGGAAWYTFIFGRKFYNAVTGRIAALILLTSIHTMLSNMDVRAEPYLTFFTILSAYHFASFLKDGKARDLIAGSLGAACLMMIKGPYTVIPIAAAILFTLLVRRDWKNIFHWQWLVAAGVTLLFMTPVLYAYYVQFDMHPEKEVFGKTGVSGLRFFFWDSQWGRFDSTGPITHDKEDFYFLLHTILWTFAPWTIFALMGLITKFRALTRGYQGEYYTFFGFLIMFFIFTISDFQLPHYLNPLYPFLSIIAADYAFKLMPSSKAGIIMMRVQYVHIGAFVLLICLLQYFAFRSLPAITDILVILVGCTGIYMALRSERYLNRLIIPSAIAAALLIFYLNHALYPSLTRYQSETTMGNYLVENDVPADSVISFRKSAFASGIVRRELIEATKDLDDPHLADRLIYTDEEGLELLRAEFPDVVIEQRFDHFRITRLRKQFVNKDTRNEVLRSTYLLKISTR